MKYILFLIFYIPSVLAMDNDNKKMEKAIFAGGCFWCMEKDFEHIDGVISVMSGYTGGHVVNPEYKQVSNGETGHVEAIEVTYNPEQVSYEKLLELFWINIDPLDDGGQFCDRGQQYRAELFYNNENQKKLAYLSKAKLDESGKLQSAIVTKITQVSTFYPSEDYHQNYYKKNPIRYNFYRYRCGRDDRLEELWGER